MRPQPDDAKTTHPTPPAPAIPAGCRSAPRRRRRRRLRRAATGAHASPEEADSALCRRAEWVRRARLAGAGDGQLAGVLGLRRAARVGGARRGRHRGADAAGAQPGARALLHLRRPQHPAPLRRRQGPPRRACGFFRVLGVSPSIWITNCGFPVQIVTMLLEKGADVNARNYCGQVDLCALSGFKSFDPCASTIFVIANRPTAKICVYKS